MIDELVIHLGDTKTGSTTLQSVLRSGGYRLEGNQRIFYPGRNLNHNALAQCLSRPKQMAKAGRRYSALAKTLRQSDLAYGVVSAEQFQGVDPLRLKQVITEHMPEFTDRIRLISYVRPHAEKFLSSYSEQMKFGAAQKGIKAFLKRVEARGTLEYAPRFRKWRDVFGDRFELRPFVRDTLHGQDISADFLQFVTGRSGAVIMDKPLANVSLTVGQAALLRKMQVELGKAWGQKRLNRKVQSAMSRLLVEEMRGTDLGADTGKLVLPKQLTARLQDRFRADAAALDGEFFRDKPMTLALEAAPKKVSGPVQKLEAESYFSPETITAFETMVRVLCGVVSQKPADMQQGAKAALMQARKRR